MKTIMFLLRRTEFFKVYEKVIYASKRNASS